MSQIKLHSQNLITLSLLLLCGFGCTDASQFGPLDKDATYKEYFEQQKKINKGILKLNIPGTRTLDIDELFAEQVLKNCPKEVDQAIFKIKQKMFRDNGKNVILHGPTGTGKTSIAQAMAITTLTPCLFFNTVSILGESACAGGQNLCKIFEHAKKLESDLQRPCVVILDELEALIKNNYDKNGHDDNLLKSFRQELDMLKNKNVAVIGTMNSIQDLSEQIASRTSQVEIALPGQDAKKAALIYHVRALQANHKFICSDSIDYNFIAMQAKKFSHRDMQNVAEAAIKPAVLSGGNQVVNQSDFVNAVEKIKKNPAQMLKREAGTWKHSFKAALNSPKAFPFGGMILGMCYFYKTNSNQVATQKQAQENADHQYALAFANLQKKNRWYD